MNRPPLEDHRLDMSIDEALQRCRPVWPSERPDVPIMCCENCLRSAVGWVLRCARALHLAAFESAPAEDPLPDPQQHQGVDVQDKKHRQLLSCDGPWPWDLPSDLLEPGDFGYAAGACRAAAWWCETAALRMQYRQREMTDDRDRRMLGSVCWHMWQAERDLRQLALVFVQGTMGAWRRSGAVALADDVCHRLIELYASPWL